MLRMSLVLLSLTAAQSNRHGMILSDPAFLAGARNLLADSGYGWRPAERAGFVIRRRDGSLEVSPWPFRSQFWSATWQGPVPAGTVAILHTHPNVDPDPSENDALIARRLEIPVFVVTNGRLAWTDGRRVHRSRLDDSTATH